MIPLLIWAAAAATLIYIFPYLRKATDRGLALYTEKTAGIEVFYKKTQKQVFVAILCMVLLMYCGRLALT